MISVPFGCYLERQPGDTKPSCHPSETKMSTSLPTLEKAYRDLLDFASKPHLPDGTPAFLFRGERSNYPTTLSTLDRHCQEFGFLSKEYEQLENLSDYALSVAYKKWGIDSKIGAAFCQHYGLPTPMFDFTSDPKVATFFAANRREHDKKTRYGYLGVLDVARARSDSCSIFDLRGFDPAKRPQMQQGFGMMRAFINSDGNTNLDIKNPNHTSNMGLT